ncbi:MAG TPA: TonB-dependent receptor [Bryobacteraceae bacterium]|nr:TonB-dependent receptor [Bryobacteraceae bacterium]
MHKYIGVILLSVLPAFAQSDRGTITGRVEDPSAAAIPNAPVTATHQATGVKYSATTTETGNFVLSQLPIGRYDVSVESPGFRRQVRKDIEISVAQTLTLNISMEVGQVEQILEVTDAPPVVESTTSDVGTTVATRNIIDLPLSVSGNMRNPEAFIFLTPGVTGDATNTQVNGSPSRGKEILLDGASASSPESGGLLFTYPSVEAIGEFRLVSTNFSAEYGRTGGGFEVFTTRSGGNEYHGALFDYFRNDVFDARGFFAPRTPVNRQNEFGATIGGPIRIPKVYDGRNRSFIFFVYSGFRFRAGAVNELLSLAPAEFRTGNFSNLVDRNGRQIPIYDPASTLCAGGNCTREQFPGNIIPSNRISSVSRRIVELMPANTLNSLLQNYIAFGNQTLDRDQYNLKLDHSFSDRNRMSFFTYLGGQDLKDPERLPVPLTTAQNEHRDSRWLRLNYDFIVSPTTLNHFVAGYTREVQSWQKLSSNQDWPAQLGLAGVNTGPGNTFPLITFSDGYSSWGGTIGTPGYADNLKSVGVQANNVLQFTDTLTHVRGKHSWKFGGDVRWMQTNGADLALNQGRFEFRNLETAFPTAEGRTNTGNAFASFLLGAVDTGRLNILAVVPGNRYRYFSWFVQDDWKVSTRLTLNLGLRHEIFFPRTERFNNLSGFDPDLPNPGAGGRLGAIAFLGEGEGRNGRTSFADTDYKSFGPRVGFAYSLTDKTVFRGGYGISYAAGNATAGLRASQRFGFGFNAQPTFQTTDVGNTPAFYWDGGFPQNFARPPFINPTVANGTEVDYIGRDHGRPPYFQNFTFSVQRELPASILAEAAYVGVKGTRLGTRLININELDPGYLSLGSLLTAQATSPEAIAAGITLPYPTFRGTVAQSLRPYPQYLNVLSRSMPNGNSTYHALQTKMEKRFSRGVSFLAAYTWSKTISDADQIAGLGPEGQTYYNRRLEKAISTNDIPHNFALSYVLELPFGRGKRFLNDSAVADQLFGGWTFTGIHQYYSGRPVVLTANNTLPLFNTILRPDVNPGVPKTLEYDEFDPSKNSVINPAAFSRPLAGRFGTAARSYTDLRGDAFLNESFGLIKRTPLTERVLLTFRAEFFNAFNRVVFANPDGNISNASFGRVSRQQNSPRQGQLALRLEF